MYDFAKFLENFTAKNEDFYNIRESIKNNTYAKHIIKMMESQNDGNSLILCALNQKNEFIGFAVLLKTKQKESEIDIYIHRNYRNKGIGQIILKTIIEYTKYINVDTIHLKVRKNNKKAINLYQKIGFSQTKQIKNSIIFNKKLTDEIFMSLKIT
ncbi:GNAT family N-acetyltransferase [Patescibacteria group bacterium]|nr:GNAT family N-acetyltransferase [Patescibacteria group bacterium]